MTMPPPQAFIAPPANHTTAPPSSSQQRRSQHRPAARRRRKRRGEGVWCSRSYRLRHTSSFSAFRSLRVLLWWTILFLVLLLGWIVWSTTQTSALWNQQKSKLLQLQQHLQQQQQQPREKQRQHSSSNSKNHKIKQPSNHNPQWLSSFCNENDRHTFVSHSNNASLLEPGIAPLPNWIQPYVKQQNQLMQSNPRWRQERLGLCPNYHHKTTTNNNNTSHMLLTVRWMCPPDQTLACGGVGDRLYGMVMTWYMALMTHRTFVALLQPIRYPGQTKDLDDDTSSSSSTDWLTPYLQPALVSTWLVSLPLHQPQQSSSVAVDLRIHDQRQHKALLEPCRTPPLSNQDQETVHVQNNLFTEDAVLRASACWHDFLQQQQQSHVVVGEKKKEEDPRPLFHTGFWTLFRFTDRVPQAARVLKQRAFAPSLEENAQQQQQQHYMAVHMRTGQGETWEDPLRHTGDQALSQFYTCSVALHEALRQQCSSSTTSTSSWPIYVAADNNYAKQRLLDMDKNNKGKNRHGFVAVNDLEILHLVKSRRGELDNAQLAQDAVWGELHILIHATCLVMSRSKFSYMASDLSPQQPRCAVLFDECQPHQIQQAVSHVACPG